MELLSSCEQRMGKIAIVFKPLGIQHIQLWLMSVIYRKGSSPVAAV